MKNESSLGRAGERGGILSVKEARWLLFGLGCLALLELALVGVLMVVTALISMTQPPVDRVIDWDMTWGTAVILVAAGLALGLTFHGLPFQFKVIRHGDNVSVGMTEIEEQWDEYDEE